MTVFEPYKKTNNDLICFCQRCCRFYSWYFVMTAFFGVLTKVFFFETQIVSSEEHYFKFYFLSLHPVHKSVCVVVFLFVSRMFSIFNTSFQLKWVKIYCRIISGSETLFFCLLLFTSFSFWLGWPQCYYRLHTQTHIHTMSYEK